ncbi:hypothetical protein PAXRUDRAFT_716021 [Paxillus rubicundulus Ve08.2h10]|uniref:Unplaced genomic scaffold scaffold_808, whole genome shotgun sequence n=1 Tax=Paxillus rubicundulus Ve08.2h10 TaxID=930991 RepID=A0A0D0D314_9AGAM|nr:hypothetical protein PAXRUDRAFT_716021 [Paxillus rubicundulus Ve08.2h10]
MKPDTAVPAWVSSVDTRQSRKRGVTTCANHRQRLSQWNTQPQSSAQPCRQFRARVATFIAPPRQSVAALRQQWPRILNTSCDRGLATLITSTSFGVLTSVGHQPLLCSSPARQDTSNTNGERRCFYHKRAEVSNSLWQRTLATRWSKPCNFAFPRRRLKLHSIPAQSGCFTSSTTCQTCHPTRLVHHRACSCGTPSLCVTARIDHPCALNRSLQNYSSDGHRFATTPKTLATRNETYVQSSMVSLPSLA